LFGVIKGIRLKKHKLYKLISTLFISILLALSANAAEAKVAVLKNNTSASIYLDKYGQDFSTLWKDFINTAKLSEIDFEIVPESSIHGKSLNGYDAIIVPLALYIPASVESKLSEYIASGGKIIVISPGYYEKKLKTVSHLAQMVGIGILDIEKTQTKKIINWPDKKILSEECFPLSTKITTILLSPKAKSEAVWGHIEENSPAVTSSKTGYYVGWMLGNEGDIKTNSLILKSIVEDIGPNNILITGNQKQYEEYTNLLETTRNFRNQAYKYINTLNIANKSSSFSELQELLYLSEVHETIANTHVSNQNFKQAKEELEKARQKALQAYIKVLPSTVIESRTLWLDRGTIVSIKSQEEMSDLFDKIKQTGINQVYFEAVNAGFTTFPSLIGIQNPETKGYNHLRWALEEAHKRDIELHAWIWVFAVGNTRHNPIINKPDNYPGPVLERNPDWALRDANGRMLPVNQHEFWIDPSHPDARQYLLSLITEIIYKYNVDGIQLDYIRYPFQNSTTLMGFNKHSIEKFKIDTGLDMKVLDQKTLKALVEWKKNNISSFVKEVSVTVRAIRPDIQISVAVFPDERTTRNNSIQQDWETWAENGWIDVINPMIYASTPEQLAKNIDRMYKSVGNKVFIYPGIAVNRLDEMNLLNQLFVVKKSGLVGNTLFAMAHLNNEKSSILSEGPYKYKTQINPHKKPIVSSQILISGYIENLNYLKKNSKGESEFYLNSLDNLISQAQKIFDNLQTLTTKQDSKKLNAIISDITNLKNHSELWFKQEFGANTEKINQLTDCLQQSITILNFELHKTNLKNINS